MNSKKRKNITELEETELESFIKTLKILINNNTKFINFIKNKKLLLESLNELNLIVEMDNIKLTIINQIKFLITSQNKENKFEGHMLHSVISGNPGTGKTTIAKILCKIWTALGFIKKLENKKENNNNNIMDLITKSLSSSNKFLEDYYDNSLNIINNINLLLKDQIENNNEIYIINNKQNLNKINKTNKINTYNDSNYKGLELINDEIINLIKNSNSNSKIILNKTSKIKKLNNNIFSRELEKENKEEIEKENKEEKEKENKEKEIIEIEIKKEEKEEEYNFVVATREDFISEYLGQTAIKTKKVLDKALGGVLFIDEAYSLCNSDSNSKDKYGEEALTVINEYMSLYPENLIVIFSGYKEKLLKTIFKVQPGLRRRCSWFFELESYSEEGLVKIFNLQLSKNNWKLDSNINILSIFKNIKEYLEDSGGSTEKLLLYIKIAYSKFKYEDLLNDKIIFDNIITEKMLNYAIEQFCINDKDKNKKNNYNLSMYS